ncbi:hypothetical protein FHP29_16415 [Nocardioides albidus]|uniref:ATP-binding protein n=1 Tax=Nocardioides albidus TaxID=1517589 RepID=A0A5C4VPJ5_9ACTN|nr:ATP-binding protein [Nocardioides albidus]TNM37415.1 hypothetical protein FHP29_16415 [Nocardioides albidus]
MAIIDTAQKHLADQRDYVKKRHLDRQAEVARNSGTAGLVDEKMLAESMRSVRYLDEAHAAGDIIDNAIEAGASQLHIVYRTEGKNISEIAFIDDASGIEESFLPHATKWGGSSNDGSRNVFGRFGFGLPSASVNRGRKFDVYSRTSGDDEFKTVTVDLDRLSIKANVVQLPKVRSVDLPEWLATYAEANVRGGLAAVRTVIVWSHLDRLAWNSKPVSTSRFREHLGITYADWLGVCDIRVDGDTVEPVDPLFTTQGSRWYDIPDAPRADAHSPIRFEMKDGDGNKHTVTVRLSYLSVDAINARVPSGNRGAPPKVRFRVRKQYNGIFVTRNGRFIELVKPEGFRWDNYARQVGVALDFPPALDEVFGVTPDKQTIMLSEAVLTALDAAGVTRAFKSLNDAVRDERKKKDADADADTDDEGTETRPSEAAIAKALEKDIRRRRKASEETQEESNRNFQEKVKRMSKETGIPEEDVAKAQEEAQKAKPYRVDFVSGTEDDPFYTPTMDGAQFILQINTGHPWYREVYSRLANDKEMRSALELMLWVLGTCEIDSGGEDRAFYRGERREWSRLMANAFDIHPLVFSGAASKAEMDEDDPTGWVEDEDDEEAVG